MSYASLKYPLSSVDFFRDLQYAYYLLLLVYQALSFRSQKLDHEAKFDGFMKWAGDEATSPALQDGYFLVSNASYAIQLVRQINYVPQESIRYFIPRNKSFMEATEDDLLKPNFEKMNSYLPELSLQLKIFTNI